MSAPGDMISGRTGLSSIHMDELEYLMKRFVANSEETEEKFENKSKDEIEINCGQSLINDTVVISTRFYVVGISVGVIASLGLLCNLISLITLASSMTKKIIFNKLLLMLTTFDILFLMCGGIFMLHQAFNFQNRVYNTVFPNIIYPIAGISMTGKKTDSIDNSDGSGYTQYSIILGFLFSIFLPYLTIF